MLGMRRRCAMALVLSLLLLPAKAVAGPVDWKFWLQKDHCPRSSYSPCHILTPTLYRWNACVHGPHVNQYAPERYPQIAPSYLYVPFPCPPVEPATLYAKRGMMP